MVNIFQTNYEARLRSWYELRQQLQNADIKTKCVEIDRFWQYTPLVNHHLHLLDSENWPDPWQLLVENTYCTVARALGMCYTLLLVGIDNVEMVEAIDMQGNEVVLVLVDDAKYVLNYWPETAVNNHITDFVITRTYSILPLYSKIG